jgi:hypothetical protein
MQAVLRLEATQDGDLLTLPTRQIYDVLSRIAHTRRSGTTDAVAAELRTMATGPHPDPAIRADYVEYAGHVIEEGVLIVGDALGRFYGPGWFAEHVKLLIDAIGAARTVTPIDPAAIRGIDA